MLLVLGPHFEQQEWRIIVWLYLTWKQKQVAWKTAQSPLRRGRCNQVSSPTPLLCCHPQKQHKHSPQMSHGGKTEDFYPRQSTAKGSFLEEAGAHYRHPRRGPTPVMGGVGHLSRPVNLPLPPVNHIPIRWLLAHTRAKR